MKVLKNTEKILQSPHQVLKEDPISRKQAFDFAAATDLDFSLALTAFQLRWRNRFGLANGPLRRAIELASRAAVFWARFYRDETGADGPPMVYTGLKDEWKPLPISMVNAPFAFGTAALISCLETGSPDPTILTALPDVRDLDPLRDQYTPRYIDAALLDSPRRPAARQALARLLREHYLYPVDGGIMIESYRVYETLLRLTDKKLTVEAVQALMDEGGEWYDRRVEDPVDVFDPWEGNGVSNGMMFDVRLGAVLRLRLKNHPEIFNAISSPHKYPDRIE